MSGGLRGTAGRLYRRSEPLRNAWGERRFDTRLRYEPEAAELLLSPHFDDAVLDCWSLLTSSRELQVVNLFAGVPGPGRLTPWDEITGASDSAERVRERIGEDASALGRAGRRPINIANLDAQYRSGLSAPSLEYDRLGTGRAAPGRLARPRPGWNRGS